MTAHESQKKITGLYPEPIDIDQARPLRNAAAQQKLLRGIDKSDLKEIRQALKEGAEVNYWFFDSRKMNETMANPLSAAMEYRNRKVIKALLESGAAVNFNDYTIPTVEAHDLPLLKLLLKYGASPDGIRHWEPDFDDGSLNDTSLTMAVKEGRHLMVKALLEAGADVGHADNNGDCALIIARRKNDKRLIKLLNQYASEPHQSRVAADFEAENGAAAKLDEALSEAIRTGRAEDVRRLIVDNNRDVSRPLHYWDSPLLSFALLKYNEVTRPGSEELCEDELKPATSEEMVEVIKILLELDAPVDAPAVMPPLHMGTFFAEKNPQLYENMLKRVCTVDLTTGTCSSTPLMFGAVRGNLSAVKLLLQYGADPKLKDERNKTALDSARFQYKYRPTKTLETIIELLIEAGAEQ